MTDAPTIGVVGSPDVASALRSIGFQVIAGADFRSTATEISQRLARGDDFPVIVADQVATPALSPWTTKTATQTHLVVLGTTPGSGLFVGRPTRLELPATVNQLLGMLRYQGTTRPVGEFLIDGEGSVTDPSAAAVASLVEPLPLPLPEPVEVETVMFPAPGPAEVSAESSTQGFPDDLFGGGPSTHERVAVPQVPTPQPQSVAHPVLPPIASRDVPAGAAQPDYIVQPDESYLPAAPSPRQVNDYPATEAANASGPWPAPAPQWHPDPPQTPHSPAQSQDFSDDERVAPAWDEPAPGAIQPRQHPQASTASNAVPVDDADFFARRAETTRPRADETSRRPSGAKGQVIISAAGKGGVGKTTTSLSLAEMGSTAGLSVVVVDANRGQADLRKYLRLGSAPLRTVYDAYTTGDPSAGILRPSDYGHLRQTARLDVTDFAIVLGPPADLADPAYASAAVYGQIIDYARSIADLVIIDTQIIEAHRTDLWDDLLVPLLRGDAWLVAITDESSPGVANLIERLGELRQAGVSNARTLVLAAQYDNFSDEDSRFFQAKFQTFGTLVGATGVDMNFHDQMNKGRIVGDSPVIRPAVASILLRVTGRSDLFAPAPAVEERRKGRFLGGLFGGRK
ncbi:hypothetical protein [Microbacterium gorillae]|uniref:nucleotide-binding protein n=1 Tax=Microbacterium gorillae TaxID=1231063 RepID=UPI003D9664E3